MPLEQYAEWVDAPGCKTTYQEGRAGILRLGAHKEFSPGHTLDLVICKTTLYAGCDISSKILPLIVAMTEDKADERLIDYYSFDNNGVCLSHGYSRIKNGQRIVNEEHDTDISRLIEYGKVIKDLIGGYPIPPPLITHSTVIDLWDNRLRR